MDDWRWDRVNEEDLYDTPEEAALASWVSTPTAQARVVLVEPFDQGDFKGLWVTVARCQRQTAL